MDPFLLADIEPEVMIQHLITNLFHLSRLLILSLTWSWKLALLLHSSLRPASLWKPIINFFSGWVKDVTAWTVNRKSVVTGKVSYLACYIVFTDDSFQNVGEALPEMQ